MSNGKITETFRRLPRARYARCCEPQSFHPRGVPAVLTLRFHLPTLIKAWTSGSTLTNELD